ncbi:DUF1329 domain-containing protein [Halomonas campisalis]|uniref:DUF1329 domain-containing protein n=1 Tax=Billgrantia campisalis TaxID=74661 RepID=A0ABS9P5D7_9GAMM|nr:DUF1329 domain-containing protein [Halomonas campisalis]MCG6656991.1 DUF1329 domain-containing protein [Halomonas campisalis]MDR5862178.1 DUF1329 domain-containing protein [Halomonas campisalis]
MSGQHSTKHHLMATLLATSIALPLCAQAAVPPEVAAQLGANLTPFGAEGSGNKSGTIPAWSPEPMSLDQVMQDQPRLAISSTNYRQHADQLSAGMKAMFEKYPDSFKMNVYPTRRTHHMPQWIYDNTLKNATEAILVDGGNGVDNAFGGVPFPIPQQGEEVIWNHVLRWRGLGHESDVATYTVYPNGNITETSNSVVETVSYYDRSLKDNFNGMVGYYYQETTAPSRRSGELLLIHEPLNQAAEPRNAWQYIPGQRRVRRAPTVAYDTPVPTANGINVYDEVYQFNGALDRYDWQLVGKQELYIPYNDNRFINALSEGVAPSALFPANHPNPDYKRWELHRVWVVEANLTEGQRHAYAKRRFYVDEDSWQIVMSESYDGRGDLWKVNYASPYYHGELPGVAVAGHIHQDLLSGNYVVDQYVHHNFTAGRSDEFYSPQNMRRQARR